MSFCQDLSRDRHFVILSRPALKGTFYHLSFIDGRLKVAKSLPKTTSLVSGGAQRQSRSPDLPIYSTPLLVLQKFFLSFLKRLKKIFFFKCGPFSKFSLNLLQYCFRFMFQCFGMRHVGCQLPNQGLNPHPLPWKAKS